MTLFPCDEKWPHPSLATKILAVMSCPGFFAWMAASLTVRLVVATARAFACALLELLTFEWRLSYLAAVALRVSLLIPLFALLFAFTCPMMSPLDNPCASAQGMHIFPLQLTLDPHLLIQRLPDQRLLLQFSFPHAFLQVLQVFPAWLTCLPQILIHLLTILLMGGARDDKEKRELQASRVPKPTCHWFVI